MANSKLTSQKIRQIASNNHHETSSSGVGDLPSALVRNISQNFQEASGDAFDQLLGIGKFESSTKPLPKSGEMKMGETIDLSQHKKAEAIPKIERRSAAPGIDYHREVLHQDERSNKKENSELKNQIQQIQNELARLVSSADKIVQVAYGDFQVNSAPAKVGKYHINFFSWMLLVIQDARKKVEDSGAWLSVAKSKGGKKSYWGQFKKNGTSFGMSNERNVATQTG